MTRSHVTTATALAAVALLGMLACPRVVHAQGPPVTAPRSGAPGVVNSSPAGRGSATAGNSTGQTGTGVIRGRVLRADTGGPLAHAYVTVYGQTPDTTRETNA